MTRRTSTFRIEYYKETGKLYASAAAEIETGWSEDGSPIGVPYMEDAYDAVRVMRRAGKLPGLSGGWAGPIRVTHELGYPRLLFIGDPVVLSATTSAGDASTTPIGSIGP